MRQRRNIVASLLLMLFAAYWSNITLFSHAHRIDGHIYVHSHPFSGSANNPGHTHTAQQFQLIAQLSLLLTTTACSAFFAALLPTRKFFFVIPEPIEHVGSPIHTLGLRAPPVA